MVKHIQSNSDGLPIIPARKPIPMVPQKPQTVPYDPNPDVAKCGECGLIIKQIMSYCCPRGTNCPCGLGGQSIMLV